MSISASTASGLRREVTTNENRREDMSYFRGNPMTLGRNRKRALSAANEDFELLPSLAGLELKRRQLTQELCEVLIGYRQLELEIERRRIVIPRLMPSQR